MLRHSALPLLAAAVTAGLVGWTALAPFAKSGDAGIASTDPEAPFFADLEPAVAAVDGLFEQRWREEGFSPAAPADELQVLRRLSLALVGEIPSLEEIRAFEEDTQPGRLRRWTLRLLADRRFGDYFAQRLTVAFMGNHEQDQPWFGRHRFENWLAEQLRSGRPYDEIVRQMISESGAPTSRPAADFVTAETVQGEMFANRLAARSVRAFLGQRIDCAECHDHPFDRWKQADFQGLAAYFAQVQTVSTNVSDDRDRQHEVEDRRTGERRVVDPRVPFHQEWLTEGETRRQQFADWITHDQNRLFLRAIANRVWGLLFGRPFVTPVDSIPDPQNAPPSDPTKRGPPVAVDKWQGSDETELLDVLADDLAEHGSDLRRLVYVIASSRPFRLASTHAAIDASDGPEPTQQAESLESAWAVFPLTQIRPEQLSLSLEQAASIRSVHSDDDVVRRTRRAMWEQKFMEQYGALGENEFEERAANIPQMVQRMHGQFTREKSLAKLWSAAERIANVADDDLTCLETCYLVCLTRRPTPEEQRHFLPQLSATRSGNRRQVVEDIFWTLFNAPEFTWNH